MKEEYSIILTNVTKSFQIQHERQSTIYEYLTSFFSKNKNVETLTVLKDISLSIKKGEMLGILGFNGSGKTTLLRIIAKIYRQDKGKVITNGTITPLLELGTGFNGELTARENIILYGIILGLTKKQISKKIDKISKFAEIENFLDTKLKNFSSGMNARLAFATAVQVDPDILIIDEVLSVGDIAFQKKSFDEFLNFRKKKKTIIFVSHNIDQIRELCDRVILIHDGQIISEGKPDDVINQYKELAEKLKIEKAEKQIK